MNNKLSLKILKHNILFALKFISIILCFLLCNSKKIYAMSPNSIYSLGEYQSFTIPCDGGDISIDVCYDFAYKDGSYTKIPIIVTNKCDYNISLSCEDFSCSILSDEEDIKMGCDFNEEENNIISGDENVELELSLYLYDEKKSNPINEDIEDFSCRLIVHESKTYEELESIDDTDFEFSYILSPTKGLTSSMQSTLNNNDKYDVVIPNIDTIEAGKETIEVEQTTNEVLYIYNKTTKLYLYSFVGDESSNIEETLKTQIKNHINIDNINVDYSSKDYYSVATGTSSDNMVDDFAATLLKISPKFCDNTTYLYVSMSNLENDKPLSSTELLKRVTSFISLLNERNIIFTNDDETTKQDSEEDIPEGGLVDSLAGTANSFGNDVVGYVSLVNDWNYQEFSQNKIQLSNINVIYNLQMVSTDSTDNEAIINSVVGQLEEQYASSLNCIETNTIDNDTSATYTCSNSNGDVVIKIYITNKNVYILSTESVNKGAQFTSAELLDFANEFEKTYTIYLGMKTNISDILGEALGDNDVDTNDITKKLQDGLNESAFNFLQSLGATLIIISLVLGIIFYLLFIVTEWKIRSKADKPGWSIFIPIYSSIVKSQIIWNDNFKWLFMLIPFYGILYFIKENIAMTLCYNKQKWFALLWIFCRPIARIITAFSNNCEYVGYCDYSMMELCAIDDESEYESDNSEFNSYTNKTKKEKVKDEPISKQTKNKKKTSEPQKKKKELPPSKYDDMEMKHLVALCKKRGIELPEQFSRKRVTYLLLKYDAQHK